MKDLPRRFVYRFWASRRPRFPPFRQEGPELPIPPEEGRPPRAVLCSGEHTKHTVLRTIFDTPLESPPRAPKGSRGRVEKKSPRGVRVCPIQKRAAQSWRNLRESGSDARSRTPLSIHAFHSARDDDFGPRTKMRAQKCADAFCKTGPPLAPGPG